MRSKEIARIANLIGISEKTMVCIARDAREAGLVQRQPRGVHCPKLTDGEKEILVQQAVKSAFLGGRTMKIDDHFAKSRGKFVHCDAENGVLCESSFDEGETGMRIEVRVPGFSYREVFAESG